MRSLVRATLPLACVLLLLPALCWGQQELRSGKKGVSTPAPVTSTPIDADHEALDVAIKAGSITLSGADGAILDGANSAIRATVTGANALKVDPGTVTVTQGTGTNLHVVCDSGCSSSAGFADNSAFTFGTTAVNPIAGVLDDVSTNTAIENAAAIIRITAQKGMHINLRNASGTEIGTASNPLRIDPTGTTTQPVSGTITANAGTGTFTVGGTVAATQSGTWTVQPGNTANTTPWLTTINQGGNSATVSAGGALKVDGSAATQPVSGTVTANIGTSGSLALDATLTGGTSKSIVRGGAKGTTSAADVTSTASGANHQILDVAIYDGAGNQITSFGGSGGTSSSFGSAFPSTGTAAGFTDGTNMQAGRVVDADTGAGTVNVQGVNLLKRASGGPVEAGTSTDPLRIDPTGTTTQPVSGTLTVTQGTGTNLHVVCDSGCSSSAGFVDNSAFTFGTTAVNPIAGVLDDTATNTATENSAAVARITAQKGLHVNLRNNAGTELGTSGAPVRTDPTGTTTQPVSGTVTTSPPANASTNIAQINGVTPLMGNGVTGTGSQRVTIASDNTAFSVNAVQSTAAATTAPWPVSNGTVARTSAIWTSATSVDTALTISTGGFATVGMTTNTTTTITAGTLNFEVSDDSGTTWFSVTCTAIGSSISLSSLPMSANSKLSWQCPIAGYDRMRVRLNPVLTGTGQVTVGLSGSASGEVSGVTATSNLVNILGNTVVTAATGVQKVGIVGNAGAALDAAGQNAASPANSVLIGGQFNTTPTTITSGNMSPLQLDSSARLLTQPQGGVAHGATDSGNPNKIGCQARTTNRTAVTDGQRADCVSDQNGQIIVTPMAPRSRVVRSGVVTVSTTTETTLLAAGGAGVFRDLTYLKCTNNSATLVRVDLRDATAGTVIDSWALAASGGGFNLAFTVPYAQATANNNWTIQLSGAVTDVRCSCQAVEKN